MQKKKMENIRDKLVIGILEKGSVRKATVDSGLNVGKSSGDCETVRAG